jgi:hypothetical protein
MHCIREQLEVLCRNSQSEIENIADFPGFSGHICWHSDRFVFNHIQEGVSLVVSSYNDCFNTRTVHPLKSPLKNPTRALPVIFNSILTLNNDGQRESILAAIEVRKSEMK